MMQIATRSTKVTLCTTVVLVALLCLLGNADASASSSSFLAFQGSTSHHRNRILRDSPLVPQVNLKAGSSLLFRPSAAVPSTGRSTSTSLSAAAPTFSLPLLMRGGALSLKSLMSTVTGSKKLCWVALLISILAENMGTSLSKHSRDVGSVALFAAACCINLLSMGGINIALSQIEIGIAYAVWSALGVIVVTGMGIFVFKESCSPAKILCLSLIIVGVVGLNLLETAAH